MSTLYNNQPIPPQITPNESSHSTPLHMQSNQDEPVKSGSMFASKPLRIGLGLVIGGALMVFGFGAFQGTFTRASDEIPRDVVVAEVGDTSAKLSWATGVDTQGVVEYGTTPTQFNFFAPEVVKTKAHALDLTLLAPSTTYYFQIRIGENKYDNGGVPWTFTTRAAGSEPITEGTPALNSVSPTPIQSLQIPDNGSAAPAASSCSETSCDAIQAKLGAGCNTQDYILSLKKGQ